MDTIANVLKWVTVVVSIAVFSYILWVRNAQSMIGSIPITRGPNSIVDAFGKDSYYLIKRFGKPYRSEALRDKELLLYWNFDPITVQIHLHKNKVSRMGYLIEDGPVLDYVVEKTIKLYGGEKRWKKSDSSDSETQTLLNKRRRRTIVRDDSGVLVYGYLLKK